MDKTVLRDLLSEVYGSREFPSYLARMTPQIRQDVIDKIGVEASDKIAVALIRNQKQTVPTGA